MILVIIAAVIRFWNAFTIVQHHLTGWALIEEIVIWLILYPLAAPAFIIAGAIILARWPGNLIAWLCITSGAILVLQDIFWQTTLRIQYAGWPGVAPMALITMWLSAPNLPPLPFTLLLLRFPDGQLLSPRWQWVERLIVISALAQGIGGTLYTRLTIGLLRPIDNPLGISSLADFSYGLANTASMITLLGLGLALLTMLIRRQRTTGQERLQLKWLAYVCTLLLPLVLLILLFRRLDPVLTTLLDISAVAVGTIGIPTALAIAMLKYRLYNIDLVINRTLVYGLLTAILGFVYLVSVMLLQDASRLLTGEQSNLAIMTSSLLIAALFNPLRRRLQTEIARRFYRQSYDAAHVLASFSTVVRDEVDLQQLTNHLLDVVNDTMQPSHISLWLRDKSS
jgi:hypothetical protein